MLNPSSALQRQCNRVGPNDIDITGFTHLIFTFASIDPSSFCVISLQTTDEALYTQFTARKSTLLQTWISVGGYSFSNPGPTEQTWSNMVSSPSNRATFISSLMAFMTQYGFQGVDLDWEFPGIAARGGQPGDTANFVSLAQEMRAAFGSKYGICVAL
jgi:chitinase